MRFLFKHRYFFICGNISKYSKNLIFRYQFIKALHQILGFFAVDLYVFFEPIMVNFYFLGGFEFVADFFNYQNFELTHLVGADGSEDVIEL